MQLFKSKILLIGRSEQECKKIMDVVVKPWFDLVFVTEQAKAIKAAMNNQFDLVLCFYELDETDGFHMYSLLNRDLLQNETPFIIVFNSYNKNQLLTGIELGIDSFILPSFNADRISNLIALQIKKNKDRKFPENLKYEAVFKIIPYGVFIVENNLLIDANNQFYSLIKHQHYAKGEYYFSDIFKFNADTDDELSLFRIINGLEKRSLFKDVKIKRCGDMLFDLDLSFVKKIGSKNRIIGIVIPQKNNGDSNGYHPKQHEASDGNQNGKHDDSMLDLNVITKREKEVLKLSAKGVAVKQIAHQLNISTRTVEKHRSNIISKTQTENIVEAVFKYSKYMQSEDFE